MKNTEPGPDFSLMPQPRRRAAFSSSQAKSRDYRMQRNYQGTVYVAVFMTVSTAAVLKVVLSDQVCQGAFCEEGHLPCTVGL